MKRTRLTHVKGVTVYREFVHCDQCDRELGMYEIGQAPSEPHLCNTEICKMKTETPPTIAELWGFLDQFSRQYQLGLSAKDENFPRCLVAQYGPLIQPLRQQLLERCARPPRVPMNEDIQFFIKSHQEHSSYHAFWAWELEQRQREKEAQNEKA